MARVYISLILRLMVTGLIKNGHLKEAVKTSSEMSFVSNTYRVLCNAMEMSNKTQEVTQENSTLSSALKSSQRLICRVEIGFSLLHHLA
jgi:hypothetical protein